MSNSSNLCPECGRELPDSAPNGLCSKCLVSLAIGKAETEIQETTTDGGDEAIGSTIERYRLLEQIGEGGFGVVYMAEQREPVTRKVALKIIKLGMDTKQVIARFESERQALAMMDHPNIARVLDAGTTDSGRPYFVMELVRGLPITKFCDDNKLTTKERLGVFMDVCAAVQHAHQKGIIHRDLKPNNILVTMNDDKPMPKVIDFGIAKATAHKLTDLTLFTQFHQFVGTPAYMSPEQAQMNNKDVDTRSDIYSLGVLLYELLTGKKPFDADELMTQGQEAVLRAIREEEPLRPSNRLSTLTHAERTMAAQSRREEPDKLRGQLRGELDWVVMKALEKDRTRRYSTATELGTDIRCYLEGTPVSAVPPSAAYSFCKFSKRNRLALVSSAAILLALIGGLGVAVQSLSRERQANAKTDRLQYASDMKLAIAGVRSENVEGAFELLDRHHPAPGGEDLRGWEWHYLNRLRHQEIATKQVTPNITEIGFSPDGQTIVLGVRNEEFQPKVTRLRTSTLEEIDSVVLSDHLPDHGEHRSVFWIGGFTHLPNGALAVGTEFLGLRFVDFTKKESTPVMPLSTFKACWPPTITSDGRWMIGGYPESLIGHQALAHRGLPQSRVLRCYEVASREIVNVASFRSPDHRMLDHELRLSPDNTLAAVGCLGAQVKLFTVPALEPAGALALAGDPLCLRWSADSQMLAVACEEPEVVEVWDISSMQKRHRLQSAQARRSHDLCFNSEGSLLAASSQGRLIVLWDLLTDPPSQRALFRGHEATTLAFSPDDKAFYSGSDDGVLAVWDAALRKTSSLAELAREQVGRLGFSPDGNLLAVNGEDGLVRLFNLPEEGNVATLTINSTTGNRGPITFSPDGRLLIVGVHEHAAVIDVVTRKERHRLMGYQGTIHDITISPDSKIAYTVGEDAMLRVSDLKDGRLLKQERNPFFGEPLYAVACSQDGALIAAGGDHLGLTLRKASSLDVLASSPGVATFGVRSIRSLAFSPDGGHLACGLDNEIRLLDVPSLAMVQSFTGINGRLVDLAFSPDGKTLIGVTDRGTSQMINLNVGHAVGDLVSATGPLLSARFAPDGQSFAVSGALDGVRVFRLDKRP